jgi:hypothetical protein
MCVRAHARVCAKGVRQVVSADALTFANLGIEPRPMEDWLWEITRDHRKVTFYFAFYFAIGRCCICQRVDSVSALQIALLQ